MAQSWGHRPPDICSRDRHWPLAIGNLLEFGPPPTPLHMITGAYSAVVAMAWPLPPLPPLGLHPEPLHYATQQQNCPFQLRSSQAPWKLWISTNVYLCSSSDPTLSAKTLEKQRKESTGKQPVHSLGPSWLWEASQHWGGLCVHPALHTQPPSASLGSRDTAAPDWGLLAFSNTEPCSAGHAPTCSSTRQPGCCCPPSTAGPWPRRGQPEQKAGPAHLWTQPPRCSGGSAPTSRGHGSRVETRKRKGCW